MRYIINDKDVYLTKQTYHLYKLIVKAYTDFPELYDMKDPYFVVPIDYFLGRVKVPKNRHTITNLKRVLTTAQRTLNKYNVVSFDFALSAQTEKQYHQTETKADIIKRHATRKHGRPAIAIVVLIFPPFIDDLTPTWKQIKDYRRLHRKEAKKE